MQSSTMVVVRTLVMLAALVAVPAAALFGSSIWARLAKVVAVLQEDLDAEGDEHSEHADHGHDDAAHRHSPISAGMSQGPIAAGVAPASATPPAVSPAAPSATPYLAPTANAFAEARPLSPPTSQATAPSPTAIESMPTQPAASANASPIGSSTATAPLEKAQLASPAFWPAEPATAASPVAQAQAHEPLSSAQRSTAMAANQAAYITPADSTPMPPPPAYSDEPAGAASAAAGAAGGAPGHPNQTAIEQRLQALGALHYRLETAGAQGELFRFQCKMGLEANPNYVGYFESTSSDSMKAMQQVLQQVESWRAGVVRR